MRASLTFRLFFIFFSLLLAFWTIFIAYYYVKSDLSADEVNPSPEKLAAIVRLVEKTPGPERDALLAGIRSSYLDLDLLPMKQAGSPGPDHELLGEPVSAPYIAALGGRLLHVESNQRRVLLQGLLWDKLRSLVTRTRPARALTFRIAVGDGSVLVASSLVPVLVTPFGLPVGLAAGLLGTIAAVIAFVLFHREIHPLKKFAAAVERIDPAGDRVELPRFRASTPEIRTLRQAFERLQTRLQSLTRSRMALIGGIQHDVRSFATRLRLRVEALPDDDERERAIADINDMIDLLDNALLTTRAGFGALDQQMLELADWLQLEITDLKSIGLDVTFNASPDVQDLVILGDRLALRRILTNLIENAVKYGTYARVSLLQENEFALITVDDGGPGFDPKEADLLLEPFVRAEPSRARNTGGAGLGLAVAQTLAEAHGGMIQLARHAKGGRATLKLPIFTS
ncbi:ATP-binding protein [uncultured Roseibium sp.]|uniref:sensor histidine kinase n=1 Tax=uncultured Roseibium sp. TaxID=1936171 RepID=UPI003216613D